MPRPSRAHDEVRAIADAQGGLVTAAQLKLLGVSAGTYGHRLRTGSMWTRVLPGVHLVTGGQPDAAQRERAALLYAGPASVLTGLTALRRHRVRSLRLQEMTDDRFTPDPVFVLLPHRKRRVATSYVRIERTLRPPEDDAVVHVDGLRLATPARATADAARHLRDADDVAALVTECVRRELATVDDLRRELDDGPSRGSRFLRVALDGARLGAWSMPEARLIDVCRSTPLPDPARNVVVLTAGGEYLARPDAW